MAAMKRGGAAEQLINMAPTKESSKTMIDAMFDNLEKMRPTETQQHIGTAFALNPDLAFEAAHVVKDISAMHAALTRWHDAKGAAPWGPLNVYATLAFLRARGISTPEDAFRVGLKVRIGYLNFRSAFSLRHIWVEANGAPLDTLPAELEAAAREFGAPEYGVRPTDTLIGSDGDVADPRAESRWMHVPLDAPSYLRSFNITPFSDAIRAVSGPIVWGEFSAALEPFLHAPPIGTCAALVAQEHFDAEAAAAAEAAKARVAEEQREALAAAEAAAGGAARANPEDDDAMPGRDRPR